MSISLVSAPGNYQPAFNPIEFVFSSTNVAECDFQFICDLYVNEVFSIRLKEFPNEVDNKGYFRIDRILQDYLSFNFQPNIIDFATNPSGIVTYYLEIRERYNSASDCTGDTTLSSVLYTSPDKRAWNAALQYHGFISFTQNTYVLTGKASKFLTASKNKIKVGIEDYCTIGLLQGSTRVERMKIETYDPNNDLIDTYYLTNPYYVATSPETEGDLHLTVGVGPENINNMILDGSPPPTQPIIHGNVKFYRIVMLDETDAIISEQKDFEIDARCHKYKMFRLWWLNRLGNFDSWNFNLRSARGVNITRNQYTRLLETDYSIGDRGDGITSVGAKERYRFSSDYLTENEAVWLEDLFTSPEVYVYDNSVIRQTAEITGAVYNSGLVDFVLPVGLILETGTTFIYSVVDGSPIGMANSGSGTITGYNVVSGFHSSTVPCTINAGALITGSMTAETKSNKLIPMIVTSPEYEEKLKNNIKLINYTIDASPAYNLNIQSL